MQAKLCFLSFCMLIELMQPVMYIYGGVCSLIVVGDLGQTYNSSATLDHMMESFTDVAGHNAAPHLLYTADYSYADDYQSNGTETVRPDLRNFSACALSQIKPLSPLAH